VKGPRRRNDGLLVGHDDVTGFGRLAHEMKHAVIRFHVEVEIRFGAPVVQMAGHRVPDASGLESREAEQQLRRFADVRMDVLVDGALVGSLERSEPHRLRRVDRNLHRLEPGMRRSAHEVELCGSRAFRRLEYDVRAPHRNVQAIPRLHRIGVPVDRDLARTADIDDAQLASREERIRARFAHGFQRERPPHRGGAADDETLDVAVVEANVVRHEHFRQQIVVAQLFGTEPNDHVGVRGLQNLDFH
jgi:hypothetical protein